MGVQLLAGDGEGFAVEQGRRREPPTAGLRAGLDGDRSGLWFEMLRVVGEVGPRWVLAENVRGAVSLALDEVCAGLESAGYEVWPFVLPAAAVGAPHRRERLFVLGGRRDVVAHACGKGLALGSEPEGASGDLRDEGVPPVPGGDLWPTPSVFGNYNRRGVSPSSGEVGSGRLLRRYPVISVAETSGLT